MKFDGMNFRRANHLYFREADPDRDRDIYGNPIPARYAVVVRLADCLVKLQDNGKLHIDASKASIIPNTGHSLTNKMAGVPRFNRCGLLTRDNSFDNHYTLPVYLVYDGCVWAATHHMSPEAIAVKKYQKYLVQQRCKDQDQ